MTFAQDILSYAGDEKIKAIAVSPTRGFAWGDDALDHNLGNEPVSWDEAFPILNYEYDTGYGGQDCHDFWAWTETQVLFVHEYNGATRIASAPRNPTPWAGATQ